MSTDWIPIADAKPEDGQWCLTFYDLRPQFEPSGWWFAIEMHKNDTVFEGFMCGGHRTPTHWMPLPDAPLIAREALGTDER